MSPPCLLFLLIIASLLPPRRLSLPVCSLGAKWTHTGAHCELFLFLRSVDPLLKKWRTYGRREELPRRRRLPPGKRGEERKGFPDRVGNKKSKRLREETRDVTVKDARGGEGPGRTEGVLHL